MERRFDTERKSKLIKRLNIASIIMSVLAIIIVGVHSCQGQVSKITPINYNPTFESVTTITPVSVITPINPVVRTTTREVNVPVRVVDVRVSERHLVSEKKIFLPQAPLSPIFDPSKSIFYKKP